MNNPFEKPVESDTSAQSSTQTPSVSSNVFVFGKPSSSSFRFSSPSPAPPVFVFGTKPNTEDSSSNPFSSSPNPTPSFGFGTSSSASPSPFTFGAPPPSPSPFVFGQQKPQGIFSFQPSSSFAFSPSLSFSSTPNPFGSASPPPTFFKFGSQPHESPQPATSATASNSPLTLRRIGKPKKGRNKKPEKPSETVSSDSEHEPQQVVQQKAPVAAVSITTPPPPPPPIEEPPTLGLILREECECPLCLQLFVDAVNTPCNHSFCFSCITHFYERTAMEAQFRPDSFLKINCPLCRRALPPIPCDFETRLRILFPQNKRINKHILESFGEELEERKQEIARAPPVTVAQPLLRPVPTPPPPEQESGGGGGPSAPRRAPPISGYHHVEQAARDSRGAPRRAPPSTSAPAASQRSAPRGALQSPAVGHQEEDGELEQLRRQYGYYQNRDAWEAAYQRFPRGQPRQQPPSQALLRPVASGQGGGSSAREARPPHRAPQPAPASGGSSSRGPQAMAAPASGPTVQRPSRVEPPNPPSRDSAQVGRLSSLFHSMSVFRGSDQGRR